MTVEISQVTPVAVAQAKPNRLTVNGIEVGTILGGSQNRLVSPALEVGTILGGSQNRLVVVAMEVGTILSPIPSPDTGVGTTGDIYNDIDADRPEYVNDVLEASVPFIKFAIGKQLKANIYFADNYYLIFLKPDLTYHETVQAMSAGENILPSIDFNQLVIIRGTPSAELISAVKSTMLTRI